MADQDVFRALADPTRREGQNIGYSLNTNVVEDGTQPVPDLFEPEAHPPAQRSAP